MDSIALAPRVTLCALLGGLLLTGCSAWQDDMDQDAVELSPALASVPPAPRLDYALAQQQLVAKACTQAYAAEGAPAQQLCASTWRALLEDLIDEDERDEQEEAAQGVCLAQGVLCAALKPCQQAADALVKADKRGLSVADIATLQHVSMVCSAQALCLER